MVKKSDFAQAVELAREAQRQRAESSQQREYLRSVLAGLAKAVLGAAGADVNTGLATSSSSDNIAGASSHSSSGSTADCSSTPAPSSAAVPTTNSSDKMEEEIRRLLDEKKSLQIALMTSESALAEERAMWAKSSDRLDTVLTSKESLEEEIQQLAEELEQAKLQLEVRARQEEAHVQQNKELHELQQQFNALRQAHGEQAVELSTLRETTVGSLEASLAKQKGEKKQLKAYALQLKADMERITLERDAAAHEKELAQIAGAEWKCRVDALELEVQELRSGPAVVSSDAVGQETAEDGDQDVHVRGPVDSSETVMAARIMLIGNEDEVDESEEISADELAMLSPNRTIDSSQGRSGGGYDGTPRHQLPPQPAEEEFYTNDQFEEDVENMADTLVKEFQEIKEKTMSIFPSWDTILGDDEDFGNGGGHNNSSQNAESSNVFGF